MTDIKAVYKEEPYIKLSKMSKGFNWEIKVIGDTPEDIARLMKINEGLNKTYGAEIE